MNNEQRQALMTGVCVTVALAVYLPWEHLSTPAGSAAVQGLHVNVHAAPLAYATKYSWVWEPPGGGSRVDLRRWGVEMLALWVVIGGLMLYWHRPPTTAQGEPTPAAG